MQQIWQKKPVRILVYSTWTTLIFLISLVWTYPSDALVGERPGLSTSGICLSAGLLSPAMTA